MKYRTALLSCLVIVFSVLLAAQTYPLSEVEVRLVHTPHGGCVGPCVQYAITVRGDGTVEYDGVGLVEGKRTRTISVDEVVGLVNEFLHVRFFDALDTYRNPGSTIVRKGDTVILYGSVGGSDDPQTDLTLRIGDRRKTVTLYNNYPAELGRLPDLVERIGGPQVWRRK
jgi:hypothetical protein